MRKLSKKKIAVALLAFILIIFLVVILVVKLTKKPAKKAKNEKAKTQEKEIPKEKVDIIDVNSKTRPFAISINNTPVAVKVQTGLNKAYIVYELPTEGSTSRLLALYKDTDDLTIGTIRSARHNFIDFSLESDAIFVAYGYSHYAQGQLESGAINYINGMVHSKPFWRKNPEHLASEHTAYTSISRLKDFAYNNRKYKKESDNTVLLKYNVSDVDLTNKEGVMNATDITLPYGNIVTRFTYNPDTKMYTRVVNGKVAKDYNTKEEFTTKNIIVEKITYKMCDDHYYWDLHTIGSGNGYYITNGKAVPIKWSKANRKAKTKYTYLDGSEIEVSDGRTYIEVQVTSKKTTIK